MVETANNDGSVTVEVEGLWLNFKHDKEKKLTTYTVEDHFEGTTDTVTVLTENFNLALRAFKDENLTEAEYELAEAALGPNVRWIP